MTPYKITNLTFFKPCSHSSTRWSSIQKRDLAIIYTTYYLMMYNSMRYLKKKQPDEH